MITVQRLFTGEAPKPAGAYVQATRFGDLVHLSGQLPIRPDGTGDPTTPFEAQVRQAMANLLAVLAVAGAQPRDLLKVTAYIVGVERWPAFNAVYADLVGAAPPARTVVPVTELHHGYLVELDAVAAVRDGV